MSASLHLDAMPSDGASPVPLRPFSPAALSALTTEHYTLQSARAATTHESNGRASLYLASVAGGVVALAFVTESTGTTSTSARLFAATVLAALVLMGLLTHQRLVHLAVEDAVLGQAIARIRSSYLHAAPRSPRTCCCPPPTAARACCTTRASRTAPGTTCPTWPS